MGQLKGVRIVEIASIGPGPFCAMMLADMGPDVCFLILNIEGTQDEK